MSESPEEQLDGAKEMSFVEHLEELRLHIIRSLIAIVGVAIFVFFATDFVFKKVLFGPVDPNFLTYQGLCKLSEWMSLGDAMCYDPKNMNIDFRTFDMGEAFLLHIKVCFFGGLILAFPYILWELWRFIRPGLYEREQKATRGMVAVSSFLFLAGVAFGYFILSPFAINFLVNYQLPMVNASANMIKATSFINYMIMFTLPTGIVFELPIIVYYLAKVGLVTPDFMRQYRKHAIIAILVVAAVVTPPDVMTQIIIGIPIYILYELSIHIAARETRKREREMGMSVEKTE